ncbi:hypothetical protein HDV63DRAFT_396246 [Trichoderma sp. SZMC 28014]
MVIIASHTGEAPEQPKKPEQPKQLEQLLENLDQRPERPEQPISFDPVLRRRDFDISWWRVSSLAGDYSVSDVAICISADGKTLSIEEKERKWVNLRHVSGIRVLHKGVCPPIPRISEIARYNGMNEWALANFTDTVVCDIIPQGLLLLSERFDLDPKSLLPDITNILPELSPDMFTLYTDMLSRIFDVSAEHRILINSAKLVSMYTTNLQLKSLIDRIASSLSAPTYLPITQHMIHKGKDMYDSMDTGATILAHAIQILFEYVHRYPTPPGHGGDCRTVADRFSLEDLHRSITLMYFTIHRRKFANVDSEEPPRDSGAFLGYF